MYRYIDQSERFHPENTGTCLPVKKELPTFTRPMNGLNEFITAKEPLFCPFDPGNILYNTPSQMQAFNLGHCQFLVFLDLKITV